MIHLVVALPAEAKPILERFDLEGPVVESPFTIFEGEVMRMVVSGMGKTSSAAATASLFAHAGGERDLPWLNVGVGGKKSGRRGRIFLGSKIVEVGTNRSWSPELSFQSPCETATILTVDRPETDYAEAGLYEMEAAGFYPIARRVSGADRVQVAKIVSDTRDEPVRSPRGLGIEQLIRERVGEIAAIVSAMRSVCRR